MYADVRGPGNEVIHSNPILRTDHNHVGQSFEGGISAQPNGEAHGAYAFCALGCLAILGAPHRTFAKFVLPKSSFTVFDRLSGDFTHTKTLNADTSMSHG